MNTSLKSMIFTSLFAALMIVGAYIKIPAGPVPIVLTNLFVILSGLLLGPVRGMMSVALYLFLGLIGLPVFSGGGGPGYFAGPTGGYLVGYLFGSGAAGLISGIGFGKGPAEAAPETARKAGVFRTAAGALIGIAVIYATGLPWLKQVLRLTWSKALAAGLTPFLIGDGIKAAAAVLLTVTLTKAVPETLPARHRA